MVEKGRVDGAEFRKDFAAIRQDQNDEELAMVPDSIILEPDSSGSYKFMFSSNRGEVSGRVTVGVEGQATSSGRLAEVKRKQPLC